MGNSRVSESTKEKLKLVKKECINLNPELEALSITEDYLINRALNFFLKGTKYEKELNEINSKYNLK